MTTDIESERLLEIADRNGLRFYRDRCEALERVLAAVVRAAGGSVKYSYIDFAAAAGDELMFVRDWPDIHRHIISVRVKARGGRTT